MNGEWRTMKDERRHVEISPSFYQKMTMNSENIDESGRQV